MNNCGGEKKIRARPRGGSTEKGGRQFDALQRRSAKRKKCAWLQGVGVAARREIKRMSIRTGHRTGKGERK